MTDTDMLDFMAVFQRVVGVFPLRGERAELREVGASYFQAMRRFPLRLVDAGADVWIAQGKRFPKPAEWIEAMPSPTAFSPVVELSALEASEWLEAERRRWQGRPCGCAPCRAASVQERPIRFVPEADDNDRDVHVRIGERVVTRGHWAHGDELARWYTAKDTAMQAFHRWAETHTMNADAKKKRPSFEQRIEAIFRKPPKPDPPPVVEREPGEEG